MPCRTLAGRHSCIHMFGAVPPHPAAFSAPVQSCCHSIGRTFPPIPYPAAPLRHAPLAAPHISAASACVAQLCAAPHRLLGLHLLSRHDAQSCIALKRREHLMRMRRRLQSASHEHDHRHHPTQPMSNTIRSGHTQSGTRARAERTAAPHIANTPCRATPAASTTDPDTASGAMPPLTAGRPCRGLAVSVSGACRHLPCCLRSGLLQLHALLQVLHRRDRRRHWQHDSRRLHRRRRPHARRRCCRAALRRLRLLRGREQHLREGLQLGRCVSVPLQVLLQVPTRRAR